MIINPEYIIILVKKGELISVFDYDSAGTYNIPNPRISFNTNEFNINSFLKKNSNKNILMIDAGLIQSNESILVTSQNCSKHLSALCPELNCTIIEAEGEIGTDGTILEELSEPAINKVLHEVYKQTDRTVFVCLLNSVYNPTHEKIFFNILKVAGYKVWPSHDVV
jgi:N-methylhydantoinase A/oxoprolinase/acetone carboxylase beta subunit